MEDQRSGTLQGRTLVQPVVSVVDSRRFHQGLCGLSHWLADETLSNCYYKLLKPQSHTLLLGCLSAHSAIKIQHLKCNRKLAVRVKMVFPKRNSLRQKAITNVSCDDSRRGTLHLCDIIQF